MFGCDGESVLGAIRNGWFVISGDLNVFSLVTFFWFLRLVDCCFFVV